MDEEHFTSVIAWDIRRGSTIVRTVRFEGIWILIGGNRYKVCGSAWSESDGEHILENVDSGDWRLVRGSSIRGWLDREAVK